MRGSLASVNVRTGMKLRGCIDGELDLPLELPKMNYSNYVL